MPTAAHDRHMGTNERRLDMLEKRARDVVMAKAACEAKRAVGIWNARHRANRDLWSYPTIGAAIAVEHPWLCFYCPACRQIGEVDLRRLDRHRGATIESLIPALSCRRCSPNPPFVKLLGLAKLPTYTRACTHKLASGENRLVSIRSLQTRKRADSLTLSR
jgi:hypothetical protein